MADEHGECGARPAGQCGCANSCALRGPFCPGGRAGGRAGEIHMPFRVLVTVIPIRPSSPPRSPVTLLHRPPHPSLPILPWPKLSSSAVVSQVSRPHTPSWSAVPMCCCSTNNREYLSSIGDILGVREHHGGSWASALDGRERWGGPECAALCPIDDTLPCTAGRCHARHHWHRTSVLCLIIELAEASRFTPEWTWRLEETSADSADGATPGRLRRGAGAAFLFL